MLRIREDWPGDGIKPGVITQEHTQEALSYAYVHAIAGGAGMNLGPKTVFDYGIDGFFQPIKNIAGRLIPTGFNVEFQMKASTRWTQEGENIVYDLDARAHQILGRVDKVSDPEPCRRDEDEAEIACRGLVISGREAPAVLEL
jgi:hypothetical protein